MPRESWAHGMVPRKDSALVSEIARQLTAWIATVRLKHAARDVTGVTPSSTPAVNARVRSSGL